MYMSDWSFLMQYQIELLQEEELAYKGKVLSLDVPKEKLASLGAGLVFPDVTAKHFWTKGKIHYSVAVTSKKSNVKSKSLSKSESNNTNKEKSSKKEKATSTDQSKPSPPPVSPSTQPMTPSTSGAPAKPEASIAANSEDVKETPC